MVRTLSYILVFILFTVGADAQITGNLCGRVSSSDGKPIRGATIKLLGTSPARGAISKEDGSFFLGGIRADEYDIQISAVGFQTQTRQNVRISVDMTTSLDIQLVFRKVSGDSVVVIEKRSTISSDNGNPTGGAQRRPEGLPEGIHKARAQYPEIIEGKKN